MFLALYYANTECSVLVFNSGSKRTKKAMARKTLGLRRNLKEKERRAAITRAAIKVFSAKGYDRATMDDIVAETDFSKSLIYWYWQNKAALFSELIDICMTQYRELLQRTMDSHEPFLDKFDKLLWDFAALFNKNEQLNKLVHFGSLHSSKEKGEDFKKKVNRYYRIFLKQIEKLLRQGIDQGVIRPDIDIEAFAFVFLACDEGYIYMSMLDERMGIERAMIQPLLKYVVPNFLLKRHRNRA